MKSAKPFLKWAGGKTQLINDIEKSLPNDEISILWDLQNDFHTLEEYPEKKKEYYYERREQYNTRNTDKTTQAALFIFLNRTCFNGLYRVNRNNQYNVPIGSYKRPTICDLSNILAVSGLLQKVEILCGDYQESLNHATENTFFYFDPPYKPLSETSSFNSYAKDEFNDDEQIRLRNFCAKLNNLGHKWMVSNSDVKGKAPNDNFFDDIYSDFLISRVKATRSINANPSKRGGLNELLITNYDYEQALQTA